MQKKEIFDLIRLWCDKLLETQLDMPSEPFLNGGIVCPACSVIHGRFADMVLPLMLLYSETGDEKYLTAAKRAVDWSEYNLLSKNGDYRNDTQNRWKGTNIFFALSLGETLCRFGHLLSSETRELWEQIFITRARASVGFCEKIHPHINYNAGAAALFAFALLLFQSEPPIFESLTPAPSSVEPIYFETMSSWSTGRNSFSVPA